MVENGRSREHTSDAFASNASPMISDVLFPVSLRDSSVCAVCAFWRKLTQSDAMKVS
jgi:hypothetical protein